MCRLLGVVTRGHRTLVEVVAHELPLFTALSERHKDGWGVAWYPGGDGADGADDPAPLRPVVRKGTDTARASGDYRDAVEAARGEVMTVHLRRASVGLGLSLANTHPFVAGELTFSHNGQFDLSPALRERVLARGGRTPEGTTDSELYLSLVTAHAAEQSGPHPDWAAAVQGAAAELTALTTELHGRPPESLNCLLTTPDLLVAFADHDPAQAPRDQPKEVYDLRWRADEGRVLVSSTGYDQPGFSTIPPGGAITVHRGSLRVDELTPR